MVEFGHPKVDVGTACILTMQLHMIPHNQEPFILRGNIPESLNDISLLPVHVGQSFWIWL